VVPAVEDDEMVGLTHFIEGGSSSGSGQHVMDIGGSPPASCPDISDSHHGLTPAVGALPGLFPR
jgi:hypothetical protein